MTYLLDANAISDLMNSAAELPIKRAIVFSGSRKKPFLQPTLGAHFRHPSLWLGKAQQLALTERAMVTTHSQISYRLDTAVIPIMATRVAPPVAHSAAKPGEGLALDRATRPVATATTDQTIRWRWMRAFQLPRP